MTDSSDDTPFATYAFRGGGRETTVLIMMTDHGGKDDASFLWVITIPPLSRGPVFDCYTLNISAARQLRS